MKRTVAARSPWLFVPTLFFQQGVPVVIVQQLSVILYKRLDVSNAEIGFWTSLIAWPWILKMFWSPLIERTATCRSWVLAMQLLVTGTLVAAAFALRSRAFLPLTLAIFLLTALLSATHDVALDGYYLLALPRPEQAFFAGIRSTFFRLGWIFITGALVVLAGLWERTGISVAASWRNALLVGAGVYAALMVYAAWVMPRPGADRPLPRAREAAFGEAFRGFFGQPGIRTIVLFILLYRIAETMITKTAALFLLDPRRVGGLGFDTVEVGSILGTYGIVALVLGGLLGGFAIARFGLRACLWPMTLVIHLPNLLYVWAAWAQPGPGPMVGVVAIEQLGCGFGLSSYMVYLMYLCQASPYPTTAYAIATGLMALGAMAGGILSGFLQAELGYFWFLVCVCVSTVPGMILLGFLPRNFEPVAPLEGAQADPTSPLEPLSGRSR